MKHKQLGKVNWGNKEYIIGIRGKADLRIELENKALIVDFKTGSHVTIVNSASMNGIIIF